MITEQQRQERQRFIGGSDAAAVAGVDPYRQPFSIWAEKVGEVQPDDLSDNEAVFWGTVLEEPIRRAMAERLGVKIFQIHQTVIHPAHPFICAHVDGRIVGKNEGTEIKNRGYFRRSDYGDEGTGEVPTPDLIQCQHYMAVLGWERVHMGVLFGGQQLGLFTVERDQELIRDLTAAEVAFWTQHVEPRVPPPMDFAHRSAPDLVKRLYPGTDGSVVELPDRALELHEQVDALKERIKTLTDHQKALRTELQALVGEAAIGLLPDGSGGYTRKITQRKGYTVEPTEYVDFRFSKRAVKLAEAA